MYHEVNKAKGNLESDAGGESEGASLKTGPFSRDLNLKERSCQQSSWEHIPSRGNKIYKGYVSPAQKVSLFLMHLSGWAHVELLTFSSSWGSLAHLLCTLFQPLLSDNVATDCGLPLTRTSSSSLCSRHWAERRTHKPPQNFHKIPRSQTSVLAQALYVLAESETIMAAIKTW